MEVDASVIPLTWAWLGNEMCTQLQLKKTKVLKAVLAVNICSSKRGCVIRVVKLELN